MEDKTFEEVAGMWLAEKKHYVKKSTCAAYSLLIANHLNPSFGRERDVTEDLVQKFVFRKLEGGLSQKSVKDIIIVLKMILKYGVRNGYMELREINVRFPTERERKELEVLSLGSQQKIMRYLKDNFNFMNLGIYLCLCSGLRIGEVCALKWEDIDLRSGVIRVTKTIQRIYHVDGPHRYTEILIDTPKTINSMRTIPIAKDLQKILRPLKKQIEEDHYLLTNSKQPTEPRTYRNYYNRLMRDLGLPKLKFHKARHSDSSYSLKTSRLQN